jgi:hypothetical protein
MRWGSSRKSAAKNRTPGTVGPGKIGWNDERYRRSGVERSEQIVFAMLAGVGAGAAGRSHHPVSLQPIERPGDLDDGHVEVLAPVQTRYALCRKVWRRVGGYRSSWGGLRG